MTGGLKSSISYFLLYNFCDIINIFDVICLADKLSTDDLNSLIAHAHRRIDQLNRELAQQKATEKQHIELALERQKLEEKRAFDSAVAKALERHRGEIQAEQDRKVVETEQPDI